MVEKGHEMALIFEDDVRLVPDFVSKLSDVLEDAKGISWDIIHLGPLLPIAKEKGVPRTLYEGQGLGTHAYIISLECAKKIAPFEPELMKVSVDFQLNRFPIRIYCVGEKLTSQESIDDDPMIGLLKSTVKGDIGMNRTFDLNYLARFFGERFKPFIVILVACIALILARK